MAWMYFINWSSIFTWLVKSRVSLIFFIILANLYTAAYGSVLSSFMSPFLWIGIKLATQGCGFSLGRSGSLSDGGKKKWRSHFVLQKWKGQRSYEVLNYSFYTLHFHLPFLLRATPITFYWRAVSSWLVACCAHVRGVSLKLLCFRCSHALLSAGQCGGILFDLKRNVSSCFAFILFLACFFFFFSFSSSSVTWEQLCHIHSLHFHLFSAHVDHEKYHRQEAESFALKVGCTLKTPGRSKLFCSHLWWHPSFPGVASAF